jgi:23S rRNA pseudouridine1911/1915/1917 synthase
MIIRLQTGTETNELRLDKYLSLHVENLSRSQAANLIEQGRVTINGESCSKKTVPLPECEILIEIPEIPSLDGEEIPLTIVYEDDSLLVVDKPQGMVVHPAAGNETGTLVHALLHHCGENLSTIGGTDRPGILHRIDKDTSGLLLIAKTNEAHRKLAVQIEAHSMTRAYKALAHGRFAEEHFTVDAPIGRSSKDRKKMAVTQAHSKHAVTHFHVLKTYSAYTLLECRLETGRTHQIRVHCAYLGHPLVGDKTYGIRKEEFSLQGQLLHAYQLGFIHPVTEEYMEFQSELPTTFQEILDKLERRIQ